MRSVTHAEFVKVLAVTWANKTPTILLGRTGIGKSWMIKEFFQSKAEELKLQFFDWNASTTEEKFEVIKTPTKYYKYLDLRLTQKDPTGLEGIPGFVGDLVEWKKNLWVKAFEKGHGVIVFEEINLAPQQMQNTTYQIFLERCVGETKLSDDTHIVACGNMAEDKASVYDIAKPLITRSFIYQLSVPTIGQWTEWALKHGIDERIIAFLNWQDKYLFCESKSGMNVTTPRGWQFLSPIIKGKEDFVDLNLFSSGIIDPGGAAEFESFMKMRKSFDIADMLRHTKTCELPTEASYRYALASALSTAYEKDRDTLGQICELTMRLPPEFCIITIRMCRARDAKHYDMNIYKSGSGKTAMDKYMKYM